MTTKDTALRLALEALGTSRIMAVDEAGNYTREVTPKVITEAITACQEALAQPSEWVSIGDDEIYGMYNEPRSDAEMIEFARALEAKLKEKNHGK